VSFRSIASSEDLPFEIVVDLSDAIKELKTKVGDKVSTFQTTMNVSSSGVQISHGGLVLLRPPERQHDGGEGPYVLAIRYFYCSPLHGLPNRLPL
jgi:hypothetical protein